MREYKFRGFTVNEKRFGNGRDEWIYGNLSILDDETFDIQDINDKNWFKAVAPESVGQYTGLKDKNGKEIYEGDIVYIKGETEILDIKGKVEYSETFAQYIITNTKNIMYEAEPLGDYENIEVIGNIYDNLGLLREENNDERK